LPKCDEPLSTFAFKFNLRRYTLELNNNLLFRLEDLNALKKYTPAGAYTRPLFSST